MSETYSNGMEPKVGDKVRRLCDFAPGVSGAAAARGREQAGHVKGAVGEVTAVLPGGIIVVRIDGFTRAESTNLDRVEFVSRPVRYSCGLLVEPGDRVQRLRDHMFPRARLQGHVKGAYGTVDRLFQAGTVDHLAVTVRDPLGAADTRSGRLEDFTLLSRAPQPLRQRHLTETTALEGVRVVNRISLIASEFAVRSGGHRFVAALLKARPEPKPDPKQEALAALDAALVASRAAHEELEAANAAMYAAQEKWRAQGALVTQCQKALFDLLGR